MESKVAANQRNFTRWEVDLPCKLTYGNQTVPCRLHDLSEGGAFIETGTYLEKGSRIEVTLRSLADKNEFPLPAVVRHVGTLKGTSIVGFGIEFEGLEMSTYREIEKVIRRLGAV